MKKEACYLCDTEITAKNRTVEHIILNALGGKLKAGNLLCKSCNSATGSQADGILAKQFAVLCTLIGVSRDHGERPVLKGGRTSDGTEYLYDGKSVNSSKPEFIKRVEGDKIHISITARNEEEMERMLKGLQKKYPKFDPEEAMKRARRESAYFTEPLRYQETFGGELAFQAILKTAVNFYIYKTGDKESVSHLFDMIRGMAQLDVVKPYYPSPLPYTAEEDEVIHLLHIRGDAGERILYCYVEFFSHHSYLVVLSTNFEGGDLSHTYAYDLLKRQEVLKDMVWSIGRQAMMDVSTTFTLDKIDAFQVRANRVMKIIDRKNQDATIKRITAKVTEEVFGPHRRTKATITREMISLYSRRLAEELVRLYGPEVIGRALRGEEAESGDVI